MGSAALNLCYLAAGRFNGYWATSVHPWDVAAGILLLREAGGLVTSIHGGEFQLRRPALLAAGTPELHQLLLKILTEV
jgi:myo-inositol-1(or 4)-monophosphatase